MRKHVLLFAAAATLAAQIQFEPEARAIAAGRSPKFVVRRAHGLLVLYSNGGDLFYMSSNDLGDTFTPPQRVNHVPGEVSDHGENSAQLLTSPDEMTLYAVWNMRDPNNPMGSHVRFASGGAMNTRWSPTVTLNDDSSPVSHGFQGAGVGPDGTIYVAWLDMREKEDPAVKKGYTGGAAAVYLTRSTDGGRTWSKNIRIAGDVCPCCRVAFGFVKDRVVVAWRGAESGDMRDIFTASSADRGETWSAPALVARDGWKIKGCPHVGPSFASLGDQLYIAWYSEGGAKPAIYVASTRDGQTFTGKRNAAAGTHDPTHPYLYGGEDRIAITFQARDAAKAGGWGKMGAYYREILPNGTLSKLQRAGEGKVTLNYPSAAAGMSGRVYLGWTETSEGLSRAMLLRGRTAPAAGGGPSQ